MHRKHTAVIAALAAGVAVALPATAQAAPLHAQAYVEALHARVHTTQVQSTASDSDGINRGTQWEGYGLRGSHWSSRGLGQARTIARGAHAQAHAMGGTQWDGSPGGPSWSDGGGSAD